MTGGHQSRIAAAPAPAALDLARSLAVRAAAFSRHIGAEIDRLQRQEVRAEAGREARPPRPADAA